MINEAIANPLHTTKIEYRNGLPSYKIIGRDVTVVKNPHTGEVVTVYKTPPNVRNRYS